MSTLNRKNKKRKVYRRRQQPEINSNYNIKLFLSLGILLMVLLMQKFDVNIGKFNVDTIYDTIYRNEDFHELRDRVIKFTGMSGDSTDTFDSN